MNNREIRKKRTLTYFIEAAQDIIESEGYDGLTIRKVAAKAGYNSATLYNYFDNLDQLKMYASLKYVNEYNRDVAAQIKDEMSEREKLILMWHVFVKDSALHPEAYASIFMLNKDSGDLRKNFERYTELFPEDVKLPFGEVYSFDQYASLSERNLTMIQRIQAQEGKAKPNDAEIMNGLMTYVYFGILEEMLLTDDKKKRLQLGDKMMKYIDYLLGLL